MIAAVALDHAHDRPKAGQTTARVDAPRSGDQQPSICGGAVNISSDLCGDLRIGAACERPWRELTVDDAARHLFSYLLHPYGRTEVAVVDADLV